MNFLKKNRYKIIFSILLGMFVSLGTVSALSPKVDLVDIDELKFENGDLKVRINENIDDLKVRFRLSKHNSRLNCWNKNLGPELNLGFRNYEEGDYAIYENANSEIARKYGEGKYYVIACAKNRGGDYRRGNSDVIRIEVRDDYTNSEISLGRLKFDGDDLKIKVNEDLRKTEVRFRLSKHNSRLTCKDKKNLGPELNLGFRNYEKGDYAIYENANSEIARKYGEGKYYVIACAKQYLITPSSLVDRKRVRYGHSDVIRIEVEEDSNNSEIPLKKLKFNGEDLKVVVGETIDDLKIRFRLSKHNSRLNCWNKNLGPELNLGFRNYEEGDYAIYEDANSAIARKYGEGKYYVIACAKNRGADYRHGQSNVIRIEVEGDKKGNESFDFEDKKTKEKSNVKKARESLLLLKSYIRKRALETNGNLTSQDWMVIRYMFDQIHVYVGR